MRSAQPARPVVLTGHDGLALQEPGHADGNGVSDLQVDRVEAVPGELEEAPALGGGPCPDGVDGPFEAAGEPTRPEDHRPVGLGGDGASWVAVEDLE
jgi:hypothetical protein